MSTATEGPGTDSNFQDSKASIKRQPDEISSLSHSLQSRQTHRSLLWFVIILALLFLPSHYVVEILRINTWGYGSVEAILEGQGTHSSFSFRDIIPTEHIVWHPCYTNTTLCARLSVPLDWKNTSDLRRAAVALVKIPSKVGVTSSNYGGPILVNPGGPGGSGVELALSIGSLLQAAVDSPEDPLDDTGDDLYFDIIGFDPRGVNNTTPTFNCFPDGGSRARFGTLAAGQGIPQDDASFRAEWSRISAISGSCSGMLSGDGGHVSDLGRFVSTPVVARDMIEIVERLAEWRQNVSDHLLRCNYHSRVNPEAVEQTRWRKGKEMVLYIGFSYGTVLGATLSTMYPDRIKRVVIDGVVDMDDYYQGTWLRNLQDTDKIIDRFLEQCHEAGPTQCNIYSPDGLEGSRSYLLKAIATLKYAPIPVFASPSVAPDVVTFTDLMNQLRSAVYSPQAEFRNLAQAIFEVSSGNGTGLAKSKQQGYTPFCPTHRCRKDGPWSEACQGDDSPLHWEASASILCSDAPDRTDKGFDYHYEKWKTLRSQSWVLGDTWSQITAYCATWKARPTWRFRGEDEDRVGGSTAHPILLLSNSLDPVTPLRNAHKISSRFSGSAVLEQRSEGHCALMDASVCTAKHLRQYFQTGKLPRNGTVCERDHDSFGGIGPEAGDKARSTQDKKLREMLQELRSLSSKRPHFLGR